jgi:hypothetical protein
MLQIGDRRMQIANLDSLSNLFTASWTAPAASYTGETMKRFLHFIAPIFLMACVCIPAFSQWPSFKMDGVPRHSDGKPDLTAPAPRTADGKPDLSGLWDLARLPAGQRGQRAQRGQDGQTVAPTAPPAPPAPPPTPPGTPPLSSFKNIGSGMQGGLPAATLGCRSSEEASGR